MNKLAPLQTRLFSSRIAKTMIACFIALAMLEGVLLAGLSYRVVQADRQASHKFAQLQALALMSQMMQSSINLFYSVERYMRRQGDQRNVPIWSKQLEQRGAQIESAFTKAEFRTALLKDIKAFNSIINESAKKMYDLRFVQDGSDRESIEQTKIISIRAAIQMLDTWKYIEPELTNALAADSKRQYEASSLLTVTIAVNVVALLALVYLVNKGILVPIRELTKNCSKLHLAENIQAPSTVRNEIGSLQQSFSDLSRTISQNEQQKRLNADMLSNAQTLSLQSLSGCFDELKTFFVGDERATRKINSTIGSISRLQSSISSLVETMRSPAKNTAEPKFAQCGITELIESSISICDSLAANSTVSIHSEIAPDLVQRTVTADEQLIIRVLVNLLSNAIKFSPRGDIVKVTAAAIDKNIRFAVIDRGPGIHESELHRLFQPFKQTTSARSVKVSGTGLGLSSSKEIIEKHFGTIGCETVEGTGSTFWFDLPQELQKEQQQEQPNDPLTRNPARKLTGGLRTIMVLMMLAFIVPQSALFLTLSNKLNQVNKEAREFELQKSRFLTMQEILFRYCTWRKDLHGTTLGDNIGSASKLLSNLKDVFDRTKAAYQETTGDDALRSKLKDLLIAQYEFGRSLRSVSQNIFGAHVGGAEYDEANRRSFRTLNEMIDILSHLSTNAASSYTLGNSLRSDILWITSIAAVFNALMLLVLTVAGLKITDRISALKEKADSFATGVIPSRSLRGTDELSFLDAEFVDACTTIAESQEQKRMLLAVINHDLRSPLASIQATLETFRAGMFGPLSDHEEELVKTSQVEIGKLLNRINNLLTFEKLDSGSFPTQMSLVSMSELIDVLVSKSKRRLEEKSVSVKIENSPVGRCYVTADQGLLEVMLLELLDNAIDASAIGSTITIEIQQRDHFCHVEFKDQGPGIREGLIPTAFDRFHLVDGSSKFALGLPLAKKIADLHGATIRIANRLEGGMVAAVEFENEMVPKEIATDRIRN